MLRFNTLFVTLFVLLLTFCVGTIHIVEAHTATDDAKLEYSIKLGEYTEAYGYWETAERQAGDLKNYKQVVASEWSSNLEDLGENAIDSLGLRREDIPDMMKASIKTVMDLFDGQTLASKLGEIQSAIDDIEITIPGLKEDRDEKKVLMETARATYRSLQHRCGGCERLFDDPPADKPGHRSLLCAVNHTYYECDPSAVYMHTVSTSCPVTGKQLLLCEVSGHSVRCSGCNNNYNPWDSTLVDAHRLRTCYYCNQQYRECDTNLYCSFSPLLSHDGD